MAKFRSIDRNETIWNIARPRDGEWWMPETFYELLDDDGFVHSYFVKMYKRISPTSVQWAAFLVTPGYPNSIVYAKTREKALEKL